MGFVAAIRCWEGTIRDEWGMEISENMEQKEVRGMELLPVNTAFGREKTRTKVNGIIQKTQGCLLPWKVHR